VAEIRRSLYRLRSLFHASSLDRDLRDELDVHEALAADEFMRQGHTPREAHRLARLAVGGRDDAMEAHRDARALPLLSQIRQDAVYALRSFRRTPMVVGLAVVILALGIGANTAVFSLVNPLLLRPLPFQNADRLVWIQNDGSRGMSGATYRVDWYEQFQRHATTIEQMSGYFAFSGFLSRTLTGQGDPERLAFVDVMPGFFDLIGVGAAHGRTFATDDHTGPSARTVVLSHGFWLRRFGGSPSTVGSTITINNSAVTVIGIMPESFDFASVFTPGVAVDVFGPADLNQMRPWGNTLALVGRLKPGASIDQSRAEFATMIPALMSEYRDWPRVGAVVTDLRTHVSGSMRRSLVVLWGAVGFVLLVVCANVTNLMLVRAASRTREFAVRTALGASRRRLITQVLTEGILLAGAGALLGIPLAFGLTAWLTSSQSLSIPLLHHVRVDLMAMVVTAGIACLTGVLGTLLPALRLSSQDPQTALQSQSRGNSDAAGTTWLRRSLVVAEIALAAVLLVGAGLLGRSFVQLLDVDLGFEPSRATAVSLDLPAGLALGQTKVLTTALLDRLTATPGIQAAGLTDALPLDRNRTWGIGVPGRVYSADDPAPVTFVYVVTPGYLGAMGIPLREGRDHVTDDPMTDARPVMVSETLARALYPEGSAVGQPARTGGQPLRIVGVVADVRQNSLDEAPANQMYLLPGTGAGFGAELIVRSSLDRGALAAALRPVIADVDNRVVVTNIRSVETLVDRSVSPRRFLTELIGGFSIFALVLASLGIYGVVSYSVSQRTTEIGVRMALGATAGDVRARILRETLMLAAGGIVVGGIAAALLSGTVRTLLYSTSAADPWVFGGTAIVLATVAVVAGLVPAVRASRLNPARALWG
jgi:predicted permease